MGSISICLGMQERQCSMAIPWARRTTGLTLCLEAFAHVKMTRTCVAKDNGAQGRVVGEFATIESTSLVLVGYDPSAD